MWCDRDTRVGGDHVWDEACVQRRVQGQALRVRASERGALDGPATGPFAAGRWTEGRADGRLGGVRGDGDGETGVQGPGGGGHEGADVGPAQHCAADPSAGGGVAHNGAVVEGVSQCFIGPSEQPTVEAPQHRVPPPAAAQ